MKLAKLNTNFISYCPPILNDYYLELVKHLTDQMEKSIRLDYKNTYLNQLLQDFDDNFGE